MGKLYSSYSTATSSLLFLSTKLFEHSSIVKPKTSRISGPERYLVCFGFRGEAACKEIKNSLKRSHDFGGAYSLMQPPLLTPMVSEEELAKDVLFTSKLKAMATPLCERHTSALRAILDRADFLERVALQAAANACLDAGE